MIAPLHEARHPMVHVVHAREVAERFWGHATQYGSAPADIAAAVGHTFRDVRAGLLPWVGAEGYRALLDRSIGDVECTHPALGGLAFLGGEDPITAPVTAAEVEAAAREVEAVTVGLVVALITALGRIVGAELAVRLVDRITLSPVGGTAGTRHAARSASHE